MSAFQTRGLIRTVLALIKYREPIYILCFSDFHRGQRRISRRLHWPAPVLKCSPITTQLNAWVAKAKETRRLLSRGYGREQRDESLQHGGMGEDGITQYGIRQSCEHRDLDGCDDLPCLRSESGEAKNAITLGIDEGLQKASSLGQRAGT